MCLSLTTPPTELTEMHYISEGPQRYTNTRVSVWVTCKQLQGALPDGHTVIFLTAFVMMTTAVCVCVISPHCNSPVNNITHIVHIICLQLSPTGISCLSDTVFSCE